MADLRGHCGSRPRGTGPLQQPGVELDAADRVLGGADRVAEASRKPKLQRIEGQQTARVLAGLDRKVVQNLRGHPAEHVYPRYSARSRIRHSTPCRLSRQAQAGAGGAAADDDGVDRDHGAVLAAIDGFRERQDETPPSGRGPPGEGLAPGFSGISGTGAGKRAIMRLGWRSLAASIRRPSPGRGHGRPCSSWSRTMTMPPTAPWQALGLEAGPIGMGWWAGCAAAWASVQAAAWHAQRRRQ